MILIFPFSMRESVNYAIRARLRGEKIVGASSEQFNNTKYCDECAILPSIFQPEFAGQLKILIEVYGIKRFYTPHHLVYQHVKSLELDLEFAEGHPIAIIQEEYKAVSLSMRPDLIVHAGRIYGHMSEEKLSGIIQCFRMVPAGDALEIGHAWGKSLKILTMLAKGKVYAIDPCNKAMAVQTEANPIVTTDNIDWPLMGDICKANVPEAIYGKLPNSVTLLHIDGNHDYECVWKDWNLYGGLLIKDGWLILDDIDWSGVKRVWDSISHGFTDVYERGGALFARKL